MGMALRVQAAIGVDDGGVDPAFLAAPGFRRAQGDHALEGTVMAVQETLLLQHLRQRAGQVEAVKREDAAPPWFHPEHILVLAGVRHGEKPGGIGPQQQARIEPPHRAGSAARVQATHDRGLRSAHGRAASMPSASSRRRRSCPGGAVNCRPMGSPSPDMPSGSEIAQAPAAFSTGV